jgi:hypothetical protein
MMDCELSQIYGLSRVVQKEITGVYAAKSNPSFLILIILIFASSAEMAVLLGGCAGDSRLPSANADSIIFRDPAAFGKWALIVSAAGGTRSMAFSSSEKPQRKTDNFLLLLLAQLLLLWNDWRAEAR